MAVTRQAHEAAQRVAGAPRKSKSNLHLLSIPTVEELRRQRGTAFSHVRAGFERSQGALNAYAELAHIRDYLKGEIERLAKHVAVVESCMSARKGEAACWLPDTKRAWLQFKDADRRVVAAHGESAIDVGESGDNEIIPDVPVSIGHININVIEACATAKDGEELVEEYMGRVADHDRLTTQLEWADEREAEANKAAKKGGR